VSDESKQRIIQEYVPGKQVTLAHIIAHPDPSLYVKLGVVEDVQDAIGILTITPSEAAIIAADVSTKAAPVSIVFLDRFSGALVITGEVSSVESSLSQVLKVLCGGMLFSSVPITRS
jgi:ethanolamine utilization protein EutS